MTFHPRLTLDQWAALPREKKILNVVSELARAKHWAQKGDARLADESLERALELIDLTVEAEAKQKSASVLREWLRSREMLAALYAAPLKSPDELVLLSKNILDFDAAVHNLQIEI